MVLIGTHVSESPGLSKAVSGNFSVLLWSFAKSSLLENRLPKTRPFVAEVDSPAQFCTMRSVSGTWVEIICQGLYLCEVG